MEVIIKKNPVDACRLAARLIAQCIRNKPNAVLGLATGHTPLPVYAELIQLHREEQLDFQRITTFNLDEYVGLGPEQPYSYYRFMMEVLFDHINVPRDRIHIPNGLADDIPRSCEEYEQAIHAAGGIDLQLLGLGVDGHIGFNEPSSSLSSRTRVKALTEKTRESNRCFFPSGVEVPLHAITMGIGTIRDAKRCVLLAYGKHKASALAKMVEGPITAMTPASALQLHPSTVVIVDEEAASELSQADYYRYVYHHKPAWQRFE